MPIEKQHRIPEVFIHPKSLGDLTPNALKQQVDERMRAVGLGNIVEKGEFSIVEFKLEDGRVVKIPVYGVDTLDFSRMGFRHAHKDITPTSRQFVLIGSGAVVKPRHQHEGENELIKEYVETQEMFEADYPVVPQVSLIRSKKSGEYFAVEPKGCPLKDKIDEAGRLFVEKGDASGLDDCMRTIGRLINKLRSLDIHWFFGDIDAVILFNSERGIDGLITDNKYLYDGFDSEPGWTRRIIEYASKRALPTPLIRDIIPKIRTENPNARDIDVDIQSRREYGRQYSENEQRRKALQERLKGVVENESGIKIELQKEE